MLLTPHGGLAENTLISQKVDPTQWQSKGVPEKRKPQGEPFLVHHFDGRGAGQSVLRQELVDGAVKALCAGAVVPQDVDDQGVVEEP